MCSKQLAPEVDHIVRKGSSFSRRRQRVPLWGTPDGTRPGRPAPGVHSVFVTDPGWATGHRGPPTSSEGKIRPWAQPTSRNPSPRPTGYPGRGRAPADPASADAQAQGRSTCRAEKKRQSARLKRTPCKPAEGGTGLRAEKKNALARGRQGATRLRPLRADLLSRGPVAVGWRPPSRRRRKPKDLLSKVSVRRGSQPRQPGSYQPSGRSEKGGNRRW